MHLHIHSRFLLCFLASLALLSGCNKESRDCTTAGCSNTPTSLRSTAPLALDSLVGATLRVCHQGQCYRTAAGVKDGDSVRFVAATGGWTSAIATPVGGQTRVEAGIGPGDLTEVETVSLEIDGAKGEALFSRSREAELWFYPNGKDCDGDYHCVGGIVDL